MIRLFKSLCTLVGFLVIVAVVLYFNRNSAVRILLEKTGEQTTALPLTISKTDVDGKWPLHFVASSLLLKNPPEFPQPIAVNIARLEGIGSLNFWKNQTLTLDRSVWVISEITVVRNASGEFNLSRFRGGRPLDLQEKNFWQPDLFIKELNLTVEQVAFYDYLNHPSPQPTIYPLQVREWELRNVSGMRQIQQLILKIIFDRTPLKLPGLSFDNLQSSSLNSHPLQILFPNLNNP